MKEKKSLITGIILIIAFGVFTLMLCIIDVKPIGQNGTDIGFSTLNCWFHNMTGVNMTLYYITDWLGLLPILCCMFFGVLGFIQLIKRKNLLKVDFDIITLGIYYIAVIILYLLFERFSINYRPILIEGILETSYPSSTTLLVLSVMLTVWFQNNRRVKNTVIKKVVNIFIVLFSLFMVIGRAVSGVHWLTDVIGSVILSVGMYLIYKSSVLLMEEKNGIQ